MIWRDFTLIEQNSYAQVLFWPVLLQRWDLNLTPLFFQYSDAHMEATLLCTSEMLCMLPTKLFIKNRNCSFFQTFLSVTSELHERH